VNFVPRTFVPVLVALSLWSSPQVMAQARAGQRSLLSQLYGDLALEARTRGQGSLTIGVADARASLVITVMATDLRRWSDSATRILAARTARRGASARWDASVAGPGVVAGSMSLSRTIEAGDTTIVLLVTDTAFKAVRTELTADEARSLAAALKRAAMASMPSRPTPVPATPKKPPGSR
jgi:hypothetical protein